MKKHVFLLSLSLGIVLILIQSVLFTKTASTARSAPKQPSQKLTRLSAQITVQAVGQGNPLINLRSGRDLLTSYLGSSDAQLILEQNLARPTVLAAADFDEDGTPDLIAGYAGPLGGVLTIHRGNVDAIYPNSAEAKQRIAEGSFSESPFLAPALVLELPEAPDFLATGDFDADGHWDVATASYASNSLYLLSGDGQGSFASPKPRDLPGTVTALASGEINRADGLTDVAIAVAGEQGAKVLVFEGPEGAFSSNPEAFPLPAPATGLVLAKLDQDYLIDLGVAAGSEVLVIEGRDRKLSLDEARQAEVTQANVTREPLPFAVTSISAGNFTGGQGEELAVLAEDGTLHILSRPQITGIEKEADVAARWTSELWATGSWSGAARLVSARVSTSGADDLLIAGTANDQLQIVTKATGERSISETEEQRGRVVASLTVAGGSAAVLPMRLNADALSDLVILRSNQAAPTILVSPQGPLAPFTVTNTNDSGAGSLRDAITLANGLSGADLISFSIGQGGPQTINPLTALPTITDPVTIDGTTQPGFAGTPIIELNGTGLPPGTNGLLITGGSTTVKGLVINRFGGNADAIEFQTNGGNIVEGNFIGTDFTGNSALPNGGNGVFINGPPNNTIGGTTVAARNVISGNARGIFVSGINSTGNLVQGNFIGTNAAGTADLGNSTVGVNVAQAVTTIGGTVAGARNIISGNDNSGIGFDASSGNLVQGNLIGTDVTGTIDLGNTQMGVQATTASANNTFGGTTPAARNIVSGNNSHGFQIRQTGTNGNLIQGSFIGIRIDGTSALGNGNTGVTISNNAANTVIGGTASGARNVISGNVSTGVHIFGGTGNQIQGNYIGTNGTGSAALGNGDGMLIESSSNNTIGGTTLGARNIIAGNSFGNIFIAGGGATGNLVQGNFIGTDATGTIALPGVLLEGVGLGTGANNNIIGGTTAAARNIISGNPGIGVDILGGTLGNVIQGNFIGTDVTGTAPLGNRLAGVAFSGGNGTTVGGTGLGAGNTIAFNAQGGVHVNFGTGNAILSNSIFSNAGLGIRLNSTTGANNNQAAPVLTSVQSASGSTTITGTLNSTPTTAFNIQFFANDACDPSGAGEGQSFLASTSTTTDASGSANFTMTFGIGIPVSQTVTATATDPNNNTSAFSQCRQVSTGNLNISGRIVDDSAVSIGGVTIILSGEASGSTTTDGNGNYSFTNLGAGNYTVTPSSSTYSFSPASRTFNNLNVNRIAHFVGTQTVVSITGTVTSANNVGISNVTVQLFKNGAPNGTAITDSLGTYGFGSLAAGANYVVTPVGSFSPSSQSFTSLAVNVVANFTASPSIPPQCNTSGFAPATNFAAVSGSRAVAIGDFNNDGKSDLAVANGASGNVSILLGSGTGSFSAPANFAVGSVPESVAIGDFNNDGNSDLAVANQVSGNVSILLGSGTGSFSAATNFAVGSVPLSVAIGDFNVDGKSDLVVANRSSNNVSILLGSGTGSFSAATNFPLGQGPRFVAIGDFNGDGKSDLATPNQVSNDVSILLGSGTGSFSAATNFPVGLFPISVAIGDFNGDGKSDLATANVNSDNVSILLGSGTGSFSAATNLTAGSVPESVVIGDLNGDGKSDLAVANVNSDNVSILLGSGTGSFSAATNFAVGSFPRNAAIGDFNGDGKSDLATANNNSNNVSILLNNSATCNTQPSLTISGRIANASNSALSDVAVTLSGPITRVVQTDLNGNYSFPNLVPGGNYSVTVQSTHFVFAASRTDFTSLSSNQTADFTVVPLVVPSPSPPPSDDFNSPTRDPNKWNLGTQTQPAGAFDPQIRVGQINGQLVIAPLAQVSGMHYNGYVSANSFDLRGGSAGVELVQAATGGADTIFAIGSDSDNFYRFMVHTAGPGPSPTPGGRGRDGIERPLETTVAQLVFQINVGGVLTVGGPITYDPVAHRFMRFRHDAPVNAIVFETSPDNIAFTERHRVTLVRSVSALTAELSAGTSNPTNPGATVFDNFGLVTSTFQFSAASYTVDEGGGSIQITVTRAGSTAAAASVDFATSDGTALQTTDYIIAAGRLTFAPGETIKTFQVLIINNAQAEGDENLNLLLQDPAASGLNTPGRAVLTITDTDSTEAPSNPVDEPTFFVTQHYLDFLNRVPDPGGLAFWVDQITGCGTDSQCIGVKRVFVSAAYFLSIEFQETGLFVIRSQRTAFGRKSDTGGSRFMYLEFVRDARQVGDGVIVGQPGSGQRLEDNKQAYATQIANSAAFVARFPMGQTPSQYVDALFASATVTPTVAEKDAAIAAFAAGGRVAALRSVTDSSSVRQAEFNAAFVLMQYYGYLRRDPDEPGYQFWLTKLNQFNGNFDNADMVKSFITSGEYRHRFGP